MLTRAIHRCRRRAGAFVAINCAALPESLIAGELFGHAPGAFTGAAPRGRKGFIEAADGGTLFLDEIGDMATTLQSRLLRVLAEREVVLEGAQTPVPVDLHIISATHRDLAEMVRDGRFREDLFYRLNAALLSLPPRREHVDLDWLIERLLRGSGLDPAAWTMLLAHRWPGNVLELINALEFGHALSRDGTIRPADLPGSIGGTGPVPGSRPPARARPDDHPSPHAAA